MNHWYYKKSFIFLAVLIVVGIYLYFANVYIYWRIDNGNLPKIEHSQETQIKNNTSSTLVYTALGDSLTFGAGAQNYKQSFPYLISKKISEARGNVLMENLSFPGATSNDLIDSQLEKAVVFNSDIITVLIGTNDVHNYVSAKKFSDNYEMILKTLGARTKAKIYAIGLPYIGVNTIYLPPFNFYFSYKINQYNEIIKSLAGQYGAVYVDIATPTKKWMNDSVNYSADSFHPSSVGYDVLSKIIYDRISR